jgi:hypothetical protein
MPGEFSIPEDMLSPIRAQVEANLAAQLGVQELDEDARTAIADKVWEAVDVQLSKNLTQVAGQAVKGSNIGLAGAGRVGVSESLRLGLENVKLVSEDQKYLELLQQSARMTKAKFDALVAAGFTERQAFRLVEAETLAKGGRAR